MPYVAIAGDMTVCFGTGLDRIREDLVDTRPHLLPTVPRLLEKAHAGLLEQLDAARGARRRLGRWALGVGERVSTVKEHGQPIPPGLALQHRARRAAAVPPRAGPLRRRGARHRVGRRGAGARDRPDAARARPAGAGGLRPDRVHDGLRVQPPAPLPHRHRRAGDAPPGAPHRRGRRDRDARPARLRRLPQRPGGDGGSAGRRLAAHGRRGRDRRRRVPAHHRPQARPDHARRRARTSPRSASRAASRRGRASRRRSCSATGARTSWRC